MLVKEKLGIKGYVKYMDDFILIHCDKWYLQYCLEEINKVCNEKLNLELNQKTQIGIAYNGIDFLGFNHILTGSGKVLWNLDFLLNKEWENISKQWKNWKANLLLMKNISIWELTLLKHI